MPLSIFFFFKTISNYYIAIFEILHFCKISYFWIFIILFYSVWCVLSTMKILYFIYPIYAYLRNRILINHKIILKVLYYQFVTFNCLNVINFYSMRTSIQYFVGKSDFDWDAPTAYFNVSVGILLDSINRLCSPLPIPRIRLSLWHRIDIYWV